MNEEPLNLMNQTLPTAEELMAEWKEFYKPETSPNEVNSNEVSREWEYPEDHNPYEEITRLKKAAKIDINHRHTFIPIESNKEFQQEVLTRVEEFFKLRILFIMTFARLYPSPMRSSST